MKKPIQIDMNLVHTTVDFLKNECVWAKANNLVVLWERTLKGEPLNGAPVPQPKEVEQEASANNH